MARSKYDKTLHLVKQYCVPCAYKLVEKRLGPRILCTDFVRKLLDWPEREASPEKIKVEITFHRSKPWLTRQSAIFNIRHCGGEPGEPYSYGLSRQGEYVSVYFGLRELWRIDIHLLEKSIAYRWVRVRITVVDEENGQ